MKVVYPSLVEQQHEIMLSQGREVDRAEIYKYMVENNMIDENGEPTQFAIDNGYVAVESDIDIIHDFKEENPLFKDIDDGCFKVLSHNTVGINKRGVKCLANKILNDRHSTVAEKASARQILALHGFYRGL
jgi:hypothetical protein